VQLLLERGAKLIPKRESLPFTSPLYCAVETKEGRVVESLLEHAPNSTLQELDPKTDLLEYTASVDYENGEIYEILLKHELRIRGIARDDTSLVERTLNSSDGVRRFPKCFATEPSVMVIPTRRER
jgi:hypothetical protein